MSRRGLGRGFGLGLNREREVARDSSGTALAEVKIVGSLEEAVAVMDRDDRFLSSYASGTRRKPSRRSLRRA